MTKLLTPEQAAEWITATHGREVSRSWVLRNFPKDLRKNWSGGEGRGVRWLIDTDVLDEWLKERVAA